MASFHSPLVNKVSRSSSKGQVRDNFLIFHRPQMATKLRGSTYVRTQARTQSHRKESNSPLEVRSSTPRAPICQFPIPSSFTHSTVYPQKSYRAGAAAAGRESEGGQRVEMGGAGGWGRMTFQCWWTVLTPFSFLTKASHAA